MTSVDTYATTGSPQVIYTSPSLPNAQHVLKVVGKHLFFFNSFYIHVYILFQNINFESSKWTT